MHEGEAMMPDHPPSSHPKRLNGHRRAAPVEPLSARVVRPRLARGYSVYELATEAGILARTIQRVESGKPIDKRVLPALATALATALDVPLCRLMCGDHNCAERACIRVRSERPTQQLRC